MSQAIAAVGQIHLASEFQKLFEKYKLKTGQILISPDDTEQRRRALNVRRTFDNLFKVEFFNKTFLFVEASSHIKISKIILLLEHCKCSSLTRVVVR